MHCGYLDEREWLTATRGDGNLQVPRVIGKSIDVPGVEWAHEDPHTGRLTPNVCPGWAVRQPFVIEACRAHKAFDKGALAALYPDISNSLAEAVQEVSRAFDEYSRQRMVELQRRSERNV